MRPGDFSPGNSAGAVPQDRAVSCFNEAGGFLPRKRVARHGYVVRNCISASMRPGDFSPGNMIENESMSNRLASMRPGDFSPGNVDDLQRLVDAALLQ